MGIVAIIGGFPNLQIEVVKVGREYMLGVLELMQLMFPILE